MKGEVIHCQDGRIIRDLGDTISIFIPMEIRRRSGRKEIITPDAPVNKDEPTPLQIALARAYVWQKWLDEGKYANAKELAKALGLDPANMRRVLRLGVLSPRIVEAVLAGKEPDISLSALQEMDIPLDWAEQEKMPGLRISI